MKPGGQGRLARLRLASRRTRSSDTYRAPSRISARISSTRHTVIRGPSLIGFGKRPVLTPFHQVDLLTGIGPAGARRLARRTKTVSGSGYEFCMGRIIHLWMSLSLAGSSDPAKASQKSLSNGQKFSPGNFLTLNGRSDRNRALAFAQSPSD